MTTANEFFDVIIVGAGPSGLACAIDAKKHNLKHLVIEKGCLANSIYHFPANMIFFSTADLLEIGNIPFIISTEKPTRTDLLKYYRMVSEHYELNVSLFEKVTAITGSKGNFTAVTNRDRYLAKNIIIATGQYDNPNLMKIPGEDLAKVSHYYTQPHSFYRRNLAIIGGKNSAVEAALDLYKNGAHVTIIHRGSDFGQSIKYWILPDIKNRVKEGKIHALFNTTVTEIKENSILINTNGQSLELENDFVFALTGYHPDTSFLQRLNIKIEDKSRPVHSPETLETNVPGIYIAGVITAGSESSQVFIENSRHHGTKIIGNILNGSRN